MQTILLTLGFLLSQALGLGLLLALGTVLTVLFVGFDAFSNFVVWLLSTWILQTILGAWVALTFQKADATAERKLDSLNKGYERKVEATKAVLRLVDQRIYASRRYLDVLESEKSMIDVERQSYREAVALWNSELKTYQISILVDFDSYYGLEFDHFYSPKFQGIDASLRSQRILVQSGQKFSAKTSQKIRDELGELNRSSLEMMRMMLRVAKRDRDALDRKSELRSENLSTISYGQLVSALLGLR